MSCVCIVQWHYTDIEKANQKNVFDVIKNLSVFDNIILAVPDIEENRQLKKYADQWGVEIFYGAVDSLIHRMKSVIDHYDADYIVRPNIDWFYMNMELVGNMLKQLQERTLDYVKLPFDMDIRFGADVFSRTYVEKLLEYADNTPEGHERYGFYMYSAAEELDIFRTEFVDTIPVLPAEGFYPIYEDMKLKWKADGTDYSDRPINSYRKAATYIEAGDRVLDCACGTGFGSALLAARASQVIGVDLEKHLIERCILNNKNCNNIEFIAGNIFEIELNEKFDKIVTLHTMEHIDSDTDFLNRLKELLKINGCLILEVPLFTKSIYKGITTPLNPTHIREYDANKLIEKCEIFFEITEIYGVNRGMYVERDRARNAMMLVMKQKRRL